MALFEIKHRLSGNVLFSMETESLKLCVEAAVKAQADLRSADLRSARNISKYITSNLYMFLDQPGKIRAYKLVTKGGYGPWYPEITYKTGQKYEVADCDTDEQSQCGAGINLATLDWCMKEWEPGRRILIAEFEASEIAAIPIGSDGKFRVKSCEIVGEKDLKELGLIKEEEKVEA